MTDRQVELQDVLATHAAARQTQEQAKAELASVEQQLLAQRASRTAHLEQRSAQVLHHWPPWLLPFSSSLSPHLM